jgi:hypothetical protein
MDEEPPPTIDDKVLAAVDSEWRTAREIYGILDEGAFISTVAALTRLVNGGKTKRRHDPYRNVKVSRYAARHEVRSARKKAIKPYPWEAR